MKAALALIFFACVAGSMAADARLEIFDQLLQQGHAVAITIFQQLQSQIMAFAQQALGQISTLIGTIGGRFNFDFEGLLSQFQAVIAPLINQTLSGLLGSLAGLIGGTARVDIGQIFADFWSQIEASVTGLGQHFLNQGLAAVLGGLGSLGGARAIGDLFATLSQQIGAAVTAAQGALTGVVDQLVSLGSNILDASKPHWEQLQEQLIGHGLNVLGSLSETINNLHGTITGGR
jgi:hypothetical protein